MWRRFRQIWPFLLLAGSAVAAPRQHTVAFGGWKAAQIVPELGLARAARIRPLLIDGKVKEFVIGMPHVVSDRLFVVQRTNHLNDALPDELSQTPKWIWRIGEWISVDRLTGHVAVLNLPVFDPENPQVSWYRDYVAYCGHSDDGAKTYMVVWQIGQRKPILKRESSGTCAAPNWQRSPSRVTFNSAEQKLSFVVHGRAASDLDTSDDEQREGPQQ